MALALLAAAGLAGFLDYKPLNLKEAERVVAAWAKANRPKVVNWHENPPLSEATPPDVASRLGAQVYMLAENSWSVVDVTAYLVRDRKVYPMAIGFGGNGMESMVVGDLDGNSKPELIYTYSWGSGFHRTHIAAYSLEAKGPTKVELPWNYPHGRIELRKRSDKRIELYLPGSGKYPSLTVGMLLLKRTAKGPRLALAVDGSLPKEFRKKIGL